MFDSLRDIEFLFYLYLYGIEIPMLACQYITKQGFYLYLYGIEILIQTRVRDCQAVLLVPLWNWNGSMVHSDLSFARFTCTFMELKSWVLNIIRVSRLFYLYLYAIEIQKEFRPVYWFHCFTCTFMELKYYSG